MRLFEIAGKTWTHGFGESVVPCLTNKTFWGVVKMIDSVSYEANGAAYEVDCRAATASAERSGTIHAGTAEKARREAGLNLLLAVQRQKQPELWWVDGAWQKIYSGAQLGSWPENHFKDSSRGAYRERSLLIEKRFPPNSVLMPVYAKETRIF